MVVSFRFLALRIRSGQGSTKVAFSPHRQYTGNTLTWIIFKICRFSTELQKFLSDFKNSSTIEKSSQN